MGVPYALRSRLRVKKLMAQLPGITDSFRRDFRVHLEFSVPTTKALDRLKRARGYCSRNLPHNMAAELQAAYDRDPTEAGWFIYQGRQVLFDFPASRMWVM